MPWDLCECPTKSKASLIQKHCNLAGSTWHAFTPCTCRADPQRCNNTLTIVFCLTSLTERFIKYVKISQQGASPSACRGIVPPKCCPVDPATARSDVRGRHSYEVCQDFGRVPAVRGPGMRISLCSGHSH